MNKDWWEDIPNDIYDLSFDKEEEDVSAELDEWIAYWESRNANNDIPEPLPLENDDTWDE